MSVTNHWYWADDTLLFSPSGISNCSRFYISWFTSPKDLSFHSIDYKPTWCGLLQTRVVCTNFYSYICVFKTHLFATFAGGLLVLEGIICPVSVVGDWSPMVISFCGKLIGYGFLFLWEIDRLWLSLSVGDWSAMVISFSGRLLSYGYLFLEHRRFVMGMSIRYLQYDLARKSLTKCVVLYRGYYN
jgi:hypothetical protein